jgi:hypothetical protein
MPAAASRAFSLDRCPRTATTTTCWSGPNSVYQNAPSGEMLTVAEVLDAWARRNRAMPGLQSNVAARKSHCRVARRDRFTPERRVVQSAAHGKKPEMMH